MKLIKLYINSIRNSPVYSNVYHLLRGQFLQYALSFITNILFVREQSVENVGAYNYILSFTSVFGILTGIWLKDIFIREIKSNSNTQKDIIGSALFISGCFSIIASLLSIISIYFLRGKGLYLDLTLIIVLQFIVAPFNIFAYYFDSDLKSKFIVNTLFLSGIIISLLKILVIYTSNSALIFMSVNTLGYIIISIGYIYVFRRFYFKISELKFNLSVSKKLLKDSYPLIFSNIFVGLVFKIDQIMVGQLSSPLDNALYSSSMKLIEIWYFLPMIIFTSYYPGIIESLVKSRDLFLFQIEKVAVMMVKVFWVIAIPMIIASPFIGKMLYGEKYADISNLIIVQVFLLFFVCLNTIRNAYFFSLNLTKEIAFLNFLTLISVYFICKCLFAKFGILGMSYGMVISYFLGTIVFNYFLKSNRVIFFILIKAAIYPFKIDFKNGSK